MDDNPRHFSVGPDEFGRTWEVMFLWLQTGISIRHADTVDVKFRISADGGPPEEKVIALPHPVLLSLTQGGQRALTDPWCMRLAGAHLRHMILTGEDMEKTLVTVSSTELAGYASGLSGSAARR